MYNNIAEKIFTKVDLENDDKACYFKNFIEKSMESGPGQPKPFF